MLYYFWGIVILYVSKMRVFTHPFSFEALAQSKTLGMKVGIQKKGQRPSASEWWKPRDPTVISFEWIPACDRQTNRQTDTLPMAIKRSLA